MINKIEKIIPLIQTPCCKASVSSAAESVDCSKCSKQYPIKNGTIYFLDHAADIVDPFDLIKGTVKKVSWLYYRVLIPLLAPTLQPNLKKIVQKEEGNLENKVVVNLGSGNSNVDSNWINIDFIAYENVDLVCDLHELPFKNDSLDCVVTKSVLEHVREIAIVIEEMRRVTRSGGSGIHVIPFLIPFHSSPYDYSRYTFQGLLDLFKAHSNASVDVISGPISVLIWVFAEMLKSLIGFAPNLIQALLFNLVCLILSPLKIVDWLIVFVFDVRKVCGNYLVILKK